MVLVKGPQGIGKTTLVDRFAGETFGGYARDGLARVEAARSAVGALRGLVTGDIALHHTVLSGRRPPTPAGRPGTSRCAPGPNR